jgi:hypothetical protein
VELATWIKRHFVSRTTTRHADYFKEHRQRTRYLLPNFVFMPMTCIVVMQANLEWLVRFPIQANHIGCGT